MKGTLGDNTDLGWMRIEIAPSAQVTQFGLFVGLAGPQQHNHEAVLFLTITMICSGERVCHMRMGAFRSLVSKPPLDLSPVSSSKMPT
jgi:hypothetical protein